MTSRRTAAAAARARRRRPAAEPRPPGAPEGGWRLHNGAILYPNVRLGRDVVIFPGAVIGRPPMSSGATIRQVSSDRLAPVEIGDRCVIGSNAVIYMGVTIGHHAMVCDTACVREGCEIGNYSLLAMGVTVNYNTRIGERVKVMDNTHLTGNMVIEDDVFIGMLVTSANDNTMGRVGHGTGDWLERGPVVRRFARVGQGSCLLPGVEIGEHAIVGANAVVTRDVPPRALVMGVPARVVRELAAPGA
ncbi:MAG: N-acetyltransferase [Candidatus Rokubacteria bacterium]|nr:N-acetyltransferase [Candidatus Rokubacteria bacterium]